MDTVREIEKNEYTYRISMITSDEDRSGFDAVCAAHHVTPLEERRGEKIHLAYPIKKQSYGFFSLFLCTTTPETIKAITNAFHHEKSMLRHAIERVTLHQSQSTVSASRPSGPRSGERVSRPVRKPLEPMLTNADLEKKIEEILQ